MTQREKRLRARKKADLVAYAGRLETIGAQMANACYNMARSGLGPNPRETLEDLVKQWDKARLGG